MSDLNIKKHLHYFEAHLRKRKRYSAFLFFKMILPLHVLMILLLGIINTLLLIIGIPEIPFPFSLLLGVLIALHLTWNDYKNIRKDLKMQSFVPVSAKVIQKKRNEFTDGIGEKKVAYSCQLKLLVGVYDVLNDVEDFKDVLETPLKLNEATHDALQENQQLFFLVAKHTGKYYCWDKAFETAKFGVDFYLQWIVRHKMKYFENNNSSLSRVGNK